ncbi:MAG: hypothetical protein E6Q24_15330 [Chitinophagaceae bacterium]|nr:MAG: hypothetical protein E6Q24_15330 [Chitinophagaceae bacterium]
MRQINEPATRIFCRLLEKMGNHESLQFTSEGFMPLTMEKVIEPVATDTGSGALYSLCHYYDEYGDLMRDPEMCFIVVDNRQHPKDYERLHIYPQYYRQDNAGLQEESIRIENNRVVSFIKVWQYAHCQFANLWLRNINRQGFLK